MQASADKIWAAAQEHLRSMLSADTYNLWFAPLHVCDQDHSAIMLEVANDFCEVWLKDNYMSLLQDVVALASGRQLQVRFKVISGSPSVTQPPPTVIVPSKALEAPSERGSSGHDFSFNPKNTFDTFVVGNN